MAKDTIAASVPLYTAVVESDSSCLNLVVTIDGVDHDVNLGNPYDSDAEQWEQIGRLWAAAPLLLAALKETAKELQVWFSGGDYRHEVLRQVLNDAASAIAAVKED